MPLAGNETVGHKLLKVRLGNVGLSLEIYLPTKIIGIVREGDDRIGYKERQCCHSYSIFYVFLEEKQKTKNNHKTKMCYLKITILSIF